MVLDWIACRVRQTAGLIRPSRQKPNLLRSSGRGQRLVESLRGRAQTAWSTAKLMALTRGENESDVLG